MLVKQFCCGEGPHKLEAVVVLTPKGVSATVCTAEHAHVGACAQSIPRPSLADSAKPSSTTNILCVPAHKDDYPARLLSERLAAEFGMPANVVAGLHIDNATPADLKKLMQVTGALADDVCDWVRRARRAAWDNVENVNAVTPEGEPLGPVDRIKAHAGEGVLHQAFATVLVEGIGADARVVLCRRSGLKRLWGNVLSDSCAGHPFEGEDVRVAAERRCAEELGIAAGSMPLTALGSIVYREDHGDGRCECEYCTVFAGRMPEDFHINEEEVSEVRRVSLVELEGYIEGRPEQICPWLRIALEDESIFSALKGFAA